MQDNKVFLVFLFTVYNYLMPLWMHVCDVMSVASQQQQMSHSCCNNMAASVTRQQKSQHTTSFCRPISIVKKSCSSPTQTQQVYVEL